MSTLVITFKCLCGHVFTSNYSNAGCPKCRGAHVEIIAWSQS